jgi:hypothetical protein
MAVELLAQEFLHGGDAAGGAEFVERINGVNA